jgi:calcium/calmodulin-dependent protein kinase I
MDVYALGVLLFVMLTGRKPWALKEVRDLSYAGRQLADAPGLCDPL